MGRPPSRLARQGRRARRTGRRAERVAARALRRAGYRILARNVRTPSGEVDVLALHDGVAVVVEVKTVPHEAYEPRDRLSGAQRRRLAAAARWLARAPDLAARPFRFDLVAVAFAGRRPVVTIRRDAFGR